MRACVRLTRPGQDRTGQDRTGQDRPGQARTRRDGTGRDRTGQDRHLSHVRLHNCDATASIPLALHSAATSLPATYAYMHAWAHGCVHVCVHTRTCLDVGVSLELHLDIRRVETLVVRRRWLEDRFQMSAVEVCEPLLQYRVCEPLLRACTRARVFVRAPSHGSRSLMATAMASQDRHTCRAGSERHASSLSAETSVPLTSVNVSA